MKLILLVFLSILSGCSSLLYQPREGLFYNPEKLNLSFKEYYIKSIDGNSLHAWYFPTANQKPKGTVIFFHGNGENLTSHYLTLHWLPAEGYNYIIFDYPGYNLSTGTPNPESTVIAGKSVIEWTMKELPSDKFFIFAHSLGGIIALRSLEELSQDSFHKINAVIIDGSFKSYQDVSRSIAKKHWLTWPLQPLTYILLSDTWAPKHLATPRNKSFLVIHGEKDPVINLDLGKELFSAITDHKEFWSVPEAGHGNLFFIEKGIYREIFVQFLNKK